VSIYQGGLLAQAIAIEEQTKTYSCMLYNENTHATTNNRYALLKDKQCIQQITRPRMGNNNASGRAIPSLSTFMLAPLPLQARSHTLYYTRCGCSFQSCPGNCMTVHSFARSKLPRQNMMNNVRLFSRVLGNSMGIDKRQSIQLCPPHTGLSI